MRQSLFALLAVVALVSCSAEDGSDKQQDMWWLPRTFTSGPLNPQLPGVGFNVPAFAFHPLIGPAGGAPLGYQPVANEFMAGRQQQQKQQQQMPALAPFGPTLPPPSPWALPAT